MTIIPKGCTAINTFTVPFDADELDSCWVTYSQYDSIVFEKSLEEIDISDGVLTVFLKQEDTLLLHSNVEVEMQIRAKYKSGSVVKSNIVVANVDKILKREAI